jgi:hypothetical protein
MTRTQSDEALLDRLQHAAFDYFLRAVNPVNGLVADTTRAGAPASIAVVGFALASYPVAVERGWMSRSEAIARTLAALRFFANSSQSERPDATGYKGFYYHFLDLQTGARTWQCELSLIDTALLFAGMLTASTYFDQSTGAERELCELAQALYRRAEWVWAQDKTGSIAHGWKPECGFLHYGWQGYNEATMLYVLGLASPDHPLPSASFRAWSATYQWENLYGQDVLYAGPLFVHQFSHAWIDFKGIRDQFMREKASDYFENSRRSIDVQRAYARLNPLEFEGYNEQCWGLSACDGPGGYVSRGAPYGPDDGTLSPPAMLASIPFAPENTIAAVRHLYKRYPEVVRDDRLPSGFNPTVPGGWISEGCFGLDQGIVVLMIEDHRSQLIWKLMRQCPHVQNGLRRAGFSGGWL